MLSWLPSGLPSIHRAVNLVRSRKSVTRFPRHALPMVTSRSYHAGPLYGCARVNRPRSRAMFSGPLPAVSVVPGSGIKSWNEIAGNGPSVVLTDGPMANRHEPAKESASLAVECGAAASAVRIINTRAGNASFMSVIRPLRSLPRPSGRSGRTCRAPRGRREAAGRSRRNAARRVRRTARPGRCGTTRSQ